MAIEQGDQRSNGTEAETGNHVGRLSRTFGDDAVLSQSFAIVNSEAVVLMSHPGRNEALSSDLVGKSLCSVLAADCQPQLMESLTSALSTTKPCFCALTLGDSLEYEVCIVHLEADDSTNALVTFTQADRGRDRLDPLSSSGASLLDAMLESINEFSVIIDTHGRIEAANEIAAASLSIKSGSIHGMSLYDCLPPGEGQSLHGKVMLACKNGKSLWFKQLAKEGDFVCYVYPICSGNSRVQHLLIVRKEISAVVTEYAVETKIGRRMQWIDKGAKNAAMKLCEPLTAIILVVQAMQENSTEGFSQGLASQLEVLQREAQNLDALRTRLAEFSLTEPTGTGTSLSTQAELLFWFYKEKHWTRQAEITLTGLGNLPRVNLSEDAAKELFTLLADYAAVVGDYALPLRLTVSGTSHGVFVRLLCIYEIDDEHKRRLDSSISDIEVSHVTCFREIICAIRSILLECNGMVRVIDSNARRQSMLIMMHCHQQDFS